jgi:hypothetical protein
LNNGYEAGLTIERIDNNGNYSPENCTWITHSQQTRNKRTNSHITIFNETKTVVEWSEDSRCKVSNSLFRNRLRKQWNPEDALTEPKQAIAKQESRLITHAGRTLTLFNWCKVLGLKPAAIYARCYRGLTPREILAPVKRVAAYGSKKVTHKT